MATVNAAREEFEAARTAALPARWRKRPSSASSSSCSTSSSSSFWRRLRTSRNSGLPPSQTDKSVPEATARARSRTGRWATTCARPSSRKRSRPATPAAPTSTAPSIGSAASSMTSCSRSSSAAPRSRNVRSARPGAGSPTTSRAVRHPSPRHQPAGRPDAVPAPCCRARAGDLRHQALRGLGYAFTMRHGRRPPWRTSCNARCRRFRINSKWLHVVGP